MKSKKSFTLIELLLVISVIAILSGILLPTLAKIKEKIKTTVCLHNLKQQTNGVYTYSGDFEGMAPNTTSKDVTKDKESLLPYMLVAGWGQQQTEFPRTHRFFALPLFCMVAYKYWPANKQLYCESAPLTAAYDWRRVRVYLEYLDQIAKKEIRPPWYFNDFAQKRKTSLSAQFAAQDLGYYGTWAKQRSDFDCSNMNCSMVNGREFNPASSATPDVPSDRPLRLGKHPSYGLMMDLIPRGGLNMSSEFACHDFRALNANWTIETLRTVGWPCGYGDGYKMSFTLPISYEDGGAALLSVKHGSPSMVWGAEKKNTLFYYFRRDNVEHSFAPLAKTTKW